MKDQLRLVAPVSAVFAFIANAPVSMNIYVQVGPFLLDRQQFLKLHEEGRSILGGIDNKVAVAVSFVLTKEVLVEALAAGGFSDVKVLALNSNGDVGTYLWEDHNDDTICEQSYKIKLCGDGSLQAESAGNPNNMWYL